MKFFIITPSFNQLAYLKRCVASVADQVAPEAQRSEDRCQMSGRLTSDLRSPISESEAPLRVHHHIQDGGSTDGTVEWLERCAQKDGSPLSAQTADLRPPTSDLCPAYTFSFSSERDAGMYDALNKGFDRASGDIFAWLNCDEQYLPGTLEKVARYFSGQPEADWVYGDALLVDPNGELMTYRKNPPLRLAYILADHLYIQSAALFFRSAVMSSGLRFDPAWKAVGDCEFAVRMLRAGHRSFQIKDYLAACTMTGENLSRKPFGVEELQRFRRQAPWLYRFGRPVLNMARHLEKLLRGGYQQKAPLEYALYSGDSNVRKRTVAGSPGSRFKWSAHE
jgi:glycosyltransferase involved in cell wall biosynthesis